MAIRDQTVAVIGAGISGLSCARRLHVDGFRVRVFDKGRGVGGRLSVRRGEPGAVFDHGAQYFTVKDKAMGHQVEQWIAAGVVAPWKGRIGSLDARQWTPTKSDNTRYVGVPGMTALAKQMALELDVVPNCRVTSIVRVGRSWQLTAENGEDLGLFDILVLSAPTPQTASLLDAVPEFAKKIQSVEIGPCWAVMLAFEERLAMPWDAAFIDDSSLSWIARNSSKPGRPRPVKPDCWVLHANPDWSKMHLEVSAREVQTELLGTFWQLLGLEPRQHALAEAHRWRFALPTEPLESRCLYDEELQLGACGDWCGGPRVEGAFLSGLAMAHEISRLR